MINRVKAAINEMFVAAFLCKKLSKNRKNSARGRDLLLSLVNTVQSIHLKGKFFGCTQSPVFTGFLFIGEYRRFFSICKLKKIFLSNEKDKKRAQSQQPCALNVLNMSNTLESEIVCYNCSNGTGSWRSVVFTSPSKMM